MRTKKMHVSLSIKARQRIIEDQGGCCVYCGLPLDGYVERHGEVIPLRTSFDHIVPASYENTNAENAFVASCQICNGIKRDLLFESLEAAQSYVLARWIRKGYSWVRLSTSHQYEDEAP